MDIVLNVRISNFWTPPPNVKCQISWLLNKKGRKQVLFGYLFKGGPNDSI